jgi:hypothetical protein
VAGLAQMLGVPERERTNHTYRSSSRLPLTETRFTHLVDRFRDGVTSKTNLSSSRAWAEKAVVRRVCIIRAIIEKRPSPSMRKTKELKIIQLKLPLLTRATRVARAPATTYCMLCAAVIVPLDPGMLLRLLAQSQNCKER